MYKFSNVITFFFFPFPSFLSSQSLPISTIIERFTGFYVLLVKEIILGWFQSSHSVSIIVSLKGWHHIHFSGSSWRRETQSLSFQPSERKFPSLLSLRWMAVNGNPEFCEVAHCQGYSVQGSSMLSRCFFYVMHSFFIPGWDFIAAICRYLLDIVIDVYFHCVEKKENTYKITWGRFGDKFSLWGVCYTLRAPLLYLPLVLVTVWPCMILALHFLHCWVFLKCFSWQD